MKAAAKKAATLVAAVVLALGVAEAALTFWAPQAVLVPRYRHSSEYGFLPYPDTTMVHRRPGRFHLEYRTNAWSHRGPLPGPANDRTTVVVLGDSNSFGIGVGEGHDYPSVLREELGDAYRVVSLAAPGWGLTQEIRRFVEVGEPLDPRHVVLQFSANDVDDNAAAAVTRLRDGRIAFSDAGTSAHLLKKVLSRSAIQHSQLYSLVRDRAYRLLARPASPDPAVRAAREEVHAELLGALAQRLAADGRALWLLDVERELSDFPHVEAQVRRLADRGLLARLDPAAWLGEARRAPAPDGHPWNEAAHRRVGRRLAERLRAAGT